VVFDRESRQGEVGLGGDIERGEIAVASLGKAAAAIMAALSVERLGVGK